MDEIVKVKLFDLQLSKNYQGIINLVKEVTKTKPDDVYALTFAVDAYRNLGENDKAIEILKHILSIDCMNIPAKLDLFDILFKLCRFEEAKPLLEEIKTFDCNEVKKNKSYYDFASDLIEAYLLKKRSEEKIYDFD